MMLLLLMNASSGRKSCQDEDFRGAKNFTFEVLDRVHVDKLDEDVSAQQTRKHFLDDSFDWRGLTHDFVAGLIRFPLQSERARIFPLQGGKLTLEFDFLMMLHPSTNSM
jgi:hypothetical protein